MTNSNGRDVERATDAAALLEADAPLDPAAMYALAAHQRRSVQSQMGDFVPIIAGAWGVAWLLGFGALWLIDGLSPAFALPGSIAAVIFAVSLVAAGGLSAWFGIRSGRGIRGSSAAAFTGSVYGAAWSVGSIGIAVLGAGLRHNGMTAELANFYYPSAFVLFAGIMYIIAGAIWQAVSSLIAGVWLVIIAAAAPFFGHPTHHLFLALAGGGAFIALSLVLIVQLRRARAAASVGALRG